MLRSRYRSKKKHPGSCPPPGKCDDYRRRREIGIGELDSGGFPDDLLADADKEPSDELFSLIKEAVIAIIKSGGLPYSPEVIRNAGSLLKIEELDVETLLLYSHLNGLLKILARRRRTEILRRIPKGSSTFNRIGKNYRPEIAPEWSVKCEKSRWGDWRVWAEDARTGARTTPRGYSREHIARERAQELFWVVTGTGCRKERNWPGWEK